MAASVDINDRAGLNLLLNALQPGSIAAWGNLAAQNMIEHLIEAVEYTNGKRTGELAFSEEEAYKQKQFCVHSDFVTPAGVKGYLSDAMIGTRYKDIPTAIEAFNKALHAFDLFFKPADRTAIHQAFGPMDYQEWITWHGKHFAHHFRQFGLINW